MVYLGHRLKNLVVLHEGLIPNSLSWQPFKTTVVSCIIINFKTNSFCLCHYGDPFHTIHYPVRKVVLFNGLRRWHGLRLRRRLRCRFCINRCLVHSFDYCWCFLRLLIKNFCRGELSHFLSHLKRHPESRTYSFSGCPFILFVFNSSEV